MKSSNTKYQQILREWNEVVERFSKPEMVHTHLGPQYFVRPYVLQARHAGYDVDVLVGTNEAYLWWDKLEIFGDLNLISLLRMIKPGDVVFDLGASEGLFAAVFAMMAGPTGKVYAFEPFPLNIEYIRLNAKLNNVRIDPMQVAIGNESGTIALAVGTQCMGDRDRPDLLQVKLEPLNNYANLKPDFVKIDIEGAEAYALEAMDEIFALHPSMHIEVHMNFLPKYNCTVDQLLRRVPLDDYITYIEYPGKPIEEFRWDMVPHLQHSFALYLLREPVYLRHYMGEPEEYVSQAKYHRVGTFA